MKVYLDSSAIVKLVQTEAHSEALRRYLRRHRSDERVTSALARVEVVRAVAGGGGAAIAKARRQLARLHHVNLDAGLLDSAATIAPGLVLRSLDAIHLACAQLLGGDLRAVVTYDQRMSTAATALGVVVSEPS
jgi:predicted nucleic acid-binding protein